MKHVACYRARSTGDTCPWRDLPILFTTRGPVDEAQAERRALRYLEQHAQVAEVRWHWEGSLQGHYLSRDQVARARCRLQAREEIRHWQEAARDAIAALEDFDHQLEVWLCSAPPDHASFMAALKALRDEGLEGWWDGSPLNVDKLHGLLVEGAWEEDERSLVERIFGAGLAGCSEDDAYLEAQAEDYGEGRI